jgi:Leucine-rich repeat (LRR) protein
VNESQRILAISERSLLEILKPDLKSMNSLEINLCESESKALNKFHQNAFNNLSSIEKLIVKPKLNEMPNRFCLRSDVNLIQSVNRLTNLKILSLKNCAIDDISENFYLGSPFVHLPNLTELDLSSNAIKKINRKCFEGLFKLKLLDMSDNDIDDIKDSPFDYLESLESLDLSNNPFDTLYWNSFGKQLKKLKKLGLSKCAFEFIQYNTFKYLDKLNEIHLPAFFHSIKNQSKRFISYGLKNECKKYFDSSVPSFIGYDYDYDPYEYDYGYEYDDDYDDTEDTENTEDTEDTEDSEDNIGSIIEID